MKKIILCMFAFAATLANANMVNNSGFEAMSGDPLAPEEWSQYKGNGATVYFAPKTDVVYEGTYSMKLAARNGYGMLHQTIGGFSGGEELSFSLLGRGDTNGDWQMDEVGDQIDVYVKFKDAANSQIGNEISTLLFDFDESTEAGMLSSSEWLQSSAFNFVTPENTAFVQIKIRAVDGTVDGGLTDGTSIYLENVSLTAIPEPVSIALLGAGALALRKRKN